MKRFLVVLAIVAVACATYVAAAPGSQRHAGATATQIAGLNKKIAALSTKVKTLQSQVNSQASTVATLNTTVTSDDTFITTCLKAEGVIGIRQYGLAPAGYVYTEDNGNTFGLTTGLDVTTSPEWYIQGVEASCVTAGGGAAASHVGAQSEPRQPVSSRNH